MHVCIFEGKVFVQFLHLPQPPTCLSLSVRQPTLGSSAPNHPITEFAPLCQPLHDKIFSHFFRVRRAALFQHLCHTPILAPLPPYFLQTLQRVHAHDDLLYIRLPGLVLCIVHGHGQKLVRHGSGAADVAVQRPLHGRVWGAGGDAVGQGRVDVFAEFWLHGVEGSCREGRVHLFVEGFCDGGDARGLVVGAGPDADLADEVAAEVC